MTWTPYGHTSKLPRLAEYIHGPPRQPHLVNHLSGASFTEYTPLTTSPRIVAYNAASLGKIHFHHMLYANGAPRPHRPLIVRGMKKRGAAWELENKLINEWRAEMKRRAGSSSGGSNTSAAAAAAASATVTHWVPLTDFRALRAVNSHKERQTASSSASLSSAAKVPTTEDPAEDNSHSDFIVLGDAPALMNIPRERRPDEMFRNVEIEGELDAGDADGINSAVNATTSHASLLPSMSPEEEEEALQRLLFSMRREGINGVQKDSSGMSKLSRSELLLLAKEKLLADRKRDAELDKQFHIHWAVGERVGCEWLQAVFDPMSTPSGAVSAAGKMSSDATYSYQRMLNNNSDSGSGGGFSSASSSIPSSIGISRPEVMGHSVEPTDGSRIKASDDFIEYNFTPLVGGSGSGAANGEHSPPIFHHPDQESFLFPTARMLIRIYVPKSATKMCVRKNRERFGDGSSSSSLTTTTALASSSFDTEGTASEAYGIERPFHDVRVIDGDVVYIPKGWGYELFREKRRVLTDTLRFRGGGGPSSSSFSSSVSPTSEAAATSPFEDESTGAIVVPAPAPDAADCSGEGEPQGPSSSSSYSSTDHLNHLGMPRSKKQHPSAAPIDRLNWHRYQRPEAEASRGLVELNDRHGYRNHQQQQQQNSPTTPAAAPAVVARGVHKKILAHLELPLMDVLHHDSPSSSATNDSSSLSGPRGGGDAAAEGTGAGPYVPSYQRRGDVWGLQGKTKRANSTAVTAQVAATKATSPASDTNEAASESSAGPSMPASRSEHVAAAMPAAPKAASSSSPHLVSCDCFRVFFKPYPQLSAEQECTYLPAMYTTHVDNFYSEGGNNPLKQFVH